MTTMNEERARAVDAMCMTWRHDFGLDRKDDELGSCGMTDAERDALRRQMGQLYDHHFAAWQRAQGAVPDALREAVEYLDDNPFNEIGAGSILHRAMRDALAAAPAQPAAHDQPDVQSEAVEVVEVVGYRFFHVDHGYIFRRTHIYEGNPSLEAHSLMTVAQHQRILTAERVPAGCKVVPVELLERLEHVTRTLVPHLQCHVDLRALLASVEGGE